MTLSLVLTIHDRSPKVSKQVADSFRLPGNQPDDIVVVLDRPTPEAKAGATAAWQDFDCPITYIELDGDPGWMCPANAWNAGFEAATGDHLYCISSDTVQAAGNLDTARRILDAGPTVIHGRAECSCGPTGTEVNWGGTAPGNLFCDVAYSRPLGFIWAGPRTAVAEINGFDPEFMKGLCYDDNDFMFRLWQTGLSFTFTNSISGTHLHHARPGLEGTEGQAKILLNQAHMLQKHGSLDPLGTTTKIQHWEGKDLIWRHLQPNSAAK